MIRRAALLTLIIMMTLLAGCTAATQTDVVETAVANRDTNRITHTTPSDNRHAYTDHSGAGHAHAWNRWRADDRRNIRLTQREDIDVVWAEYEDAKWTEPQSVPHRVTIGDDVYSYQ